MTDRHKWRTSSFTGDGNCVEVAETVHGGVLVRNSNDRNAGTLHLTKQQFANWLAGFKAGEFDDLA